MKNGKHTAWILWTLGTLGAFVGVLVYVAFGGCTFAPPAAPKHQFVVQPTPKFLTEELAIAKARETLAMDGYKVGEWEPTRASQPPTKAPDGTPDKYFDRFSFRANAGRVTFSKIKGKQFRTYDVRLEGNRVICSEFRGL
jgi:hypothetical protein